MISDPLENYMDVVTVSSKFQVVIPKSARGLLQVKPGQKMRVLVYDNQVIFIPVRPIKQARGSLKGISTDVSRDETASI
jgi:AbrB family looped-hinge helix DNA binding protein